VAGDKTLPNTELISVPYLIVWDDVASLMKHLMHPYRGNQNKTDEAKKPSIIA
jgi:hypothetical protein